MSEPADDPVSTLARRCGQRVSGVERIHYLSDEQFDRRIGPLVLHFESGQLLRLDVGPDGESLVVYTTQWKDPFGDTVEGENAAFVAASGKWTVVRVEEDPAYERTMGRALRHVQPIRNQFGSLSGARLEFDGGAVLHFLAAADEAWVMPGDFDLASWDMSLEAARFP